MDIMGPVFAWLARSDLALVCAPVAHFRYTVHCAGESRSARVAQAAFVAAAALHGNVDYTYLIVAQATSYGFGLFAAAARRPWLRAAAAATAGALALLACRAGVAASLAWVRAAAVAAVVHACVQGAASWRARLRPSRVGLWGAATLLALEAGPWVARTTLPVDELLDALAVIKLFYPAADTEIARLFMVTFHIQVSLGTLGIQCVFDCAAAATLRVDCCSYGRAAAAPHLVPPAQLISPPSLGT